ncbi:ethanolamine utilization protein EutH [Clostridium sediminicola]|uniref:ethanolamine utilization protein EutH n=1 Tax=Clostridium sediminicola TaxID=3114879 RepID=UPI0031F26EEF
MDKIILYIIGVFFVLGGIDYIIGNPMKIGKKFEEGIKTMGSVGLAMIGIYSLAPVFSKILAIVVIPLCNTFKLDPSIFPATFLAVDMGGYQLATELAVKPEIGLFSGIIIASTLGATISFSIPVAIGLISKEDEKYFSKGVMIGIIPIPIGCLLAGLWQKINFEILLWNIIPIFILAMILVAGLFLLPNTLIRIFSFFGKTIMGLSVIGLLFQGIDVIFGVKIISGLAPLSEATLIVGKIAFILGGAYPMLELINKVFGNSLDKIGRKLGINSVSVAGMLGNLASNLLIFGTYKEMNPKGKVLCTAFGISGAFVFGGQFAFVSGIAPEMIGGFIISKLTSGILSVLLAVWLYERESKKLIKNKCINETLFTSK